MNTKTAVLLLSTALLAACAVAPSDDPAPSPKHSGWFEVHHEPQGRPRCLAESGNVESERFFRCIRGWRERIWVEDFANLPQGATPAAGNTP